MVVLTIIYSIITVLLSAVDSIRIKKQMGKIENINHKVSAGLAAGTALIVVCFFVQIGTLWHIVFQLLLFSIAFTGIRLFLYDGWLNLFRHLPFAFTSQKSSSYKDQHSNHVHFWMQRIIGLALWAISFVIYKFLL